jgi:hypothetical protein
MSIVVCWSVRWIAHPAAVSLTWLCTDSTPNGVFCSIMMRSPLKGLNSLSRQKVQCNRGVATSKQKSMTERQLPVLPHRFSARLTDLANLHLIIVSNLEAEKKQQIGPKSFMVPFFESLVGLRNAGPTQHHQTRDGRIT